MNNASILGRIFGVEPRDKIVITVPLYHCFGMVIGNLLACNYGATMIYPSEGFEPQSALKCVTKYGGTHLYGVPTMFIAML